MNAPNNAYENLTLDYDLINELPRMIEAKGPAGDKPVCYTTFFFNEGREPVFMQDWETPQIDAFWLLHTLRNGSCEVNAAFRLFHHGLLNKEREDLELDGGAAISLSKTGTASVTRSLSDPRISGEIFPFIVPFTELSALHHQCPEPWEHPHRLKRRIFRKTAALIAHDWARDSILPVLPRKSSRIREVAGAGL